MTEYYSPLRRQKQVATKKHGIDRIISEKWLCWEAQKLSFR
jgi:hypothetical protein